MKSLAGSYSRYRLRCTTSKVTDDAYWFVYHSFCLKVDINLMSREIIDKLMNFDNVPETESYYINSRTTLFVDISKYCMDEYISWVNTQPITDRLYLLNVIKTDGKLL